MHDELREAYLSEARTALLNLLRESLLTEVQAALEGLPHVDRVCFRVKSLPSFLEKATDPTTRPPYSDPLVEIEDQVAGRVLVFFLSDVDFVEKCLLRTFTAVERTHKRPAKDEEFGYESRHLICNIPPPLKPPDWDGRRDLPPTFELQIRTLFMHAYAEPQHDLAYKGPRELPPGIRRELAWIAASSWGADQAYARVCDWTRGVRVGSPEE
ncbi:MAG: RelA/SpoT domain-containing protein [Acidobacteriota bacterium]